MVIGILQLLQANLSWLLTSKVEPEAVGIRVDGAAENRTLQPLLRLLEGLIGSTKKNHQGSTSTVGQITQQATNVWDAGLELFYPTSMAREKLAKDATANGVTLEFQIQFPTQLSNAANEDGHNGSSNSEFDSGDGTDVRFERLLLMLRLECSKRGWKQELVGRYNYFLHLIISIPKESAASFLASTLDRICRQSGFADGWQFPIGIRHPSVRMKIERYLRFNRHDRLGTEFSVGYVRLYARNVGSFADVCTQVRKFVSGSDQNSGRKICRALSC